MPAAHTRSLYQGDDEDGGLDLVFEEYLNQRAAKYYRDDDVAEEDGTNSSE